MNATLLCPSLLSRYPTSLQRAGKAEEAETVAMFADVLLPIITRLLSKPIYFFKSSLLPQLRYC